MLAINNRNQCGLQLTVQFETHAVSGAVSKVLGIRAQKAALIRERSTPAGSPVLISKDVSRTLHGEDATPAFHSLCSPSASQCLSVSNGQQPRMKKSQPFTGGLCHVRGKRPQPLPAPHLYLSYQLNLQRLISNLAWLIWDGMFGAAIRSSEGCAALWWGGRLGHTLLP